MNARRALILIAALSLALAPLPAAQAASAPGETAALPSGRTGEAPAAQAGQQTAPAAEQAAPAPKPAAKKPPAVRTEPIVPAYQSIKERAAVQVFFVWLWLSIGVLLYFLRWWVQEADRVYKAKFYEPVESPRKDNPFPPLLGE